MNMFSVERRPWGRKRLLTERYNARRHAARRSAALETRTDVLNFPTQLRLRAVAADQSEAEEMKGRSRGRARPMVTRIEQGFPRLYHG